MSSALLLGEYFENFINVQVQSGRYTSSDEVLRAALRLFEQEENRKDNLLNELKKGEESGFMEDFNRSSFLQDIHNRYVTHEV